MDGHRLSPLTCINESIPRCSVDGKQARAISGIDLNRIETTEKFKAPGTNVRAPNKTKRDPFEGVLVVDFHDVISNLGEVLDIDVLADAVQTRMKDSTTVQH